MLPDRCLSVCLVLSVTLVYCGQTVGRIKTSLDPGVGLGPGDIVLDGAQSPPRGGTSSNFRPMSIVAKRSPISVTAKLLSTNTSKIVPHV